MARRPHRANPYMATSEVETVTGPQTTSWYVGLNRVEGGRRDPLTALPNRPVLIIVDYSPLQELTHRSEPDHALFAAMSPHNLRHTMNMKHCLLMLVSLNLMKFPLSKFNNFGRCWSFVYAPSGASICWPRIWSSDTLTFQVMFSRFQTLFL